MRKAQLESILLNKGWGDYWAQESQIRTEANNFRNVSSLNANLTEYDLFILSEAMEKASLAMLELHETMYALNCK